MNNFVKDILDSKHSHSIKSHETIMKRIKERDLEAIGTAWSPKHEVLIEVEEYLKFKFETILPKYHCKLQYDITAIEPLYFSTINYTTYAGSVLIHPVSFEQSLRQMADAYADNMFLSYDHIDHIEKQIETDGTFSKYVYGKKKPCNPTKVLMVLTGGNKLKKHCCVGQIAKILNDFGRENVTFKKHPISHTEVYDELNEYLGGIHYAPDDADLYDLIDGSEWVFTSMLSESTLISVIKRKKIGHFDLLQNRNTTSFGHIGYYLFSTKDPVAWARRAFASPKSGLINPNVDKDWKGKIDQYLEYILELRKFYELAYMG